MIDSVGAKATGGDLRVAPVKRATPAAPATDAPATGGERAAAPAGQASALAKAMAATPPVDTDRVARIKSALAHGTFPILPAKIADQMIALKYEWMSHDAS